MASQDDVGDHGGTVASTRRSTRFRTVPLVSAGGVVYRVPPSAGLAPKEIEIVLCGRRHPPIWGLPKGTPQPGESIEETAVREVSEETGLVVQIQAKIGTIEYWFIRGGIRYHKWVHYFLMTAIGGDTSRHDQEYDEVRWFPLHTALALMTYKNEAAIVRKAAKLIGALAMPQGQRGRRRRVG